MEEEEEEDEEEEEGVGNVLERVVVKKVAAILPASVGTPSISTESSRQNSRLPFQRSSSSSSDASAHDLLSAPLLFSQESNPATTYKLSAEIQPSHQLSSPSHTNLNPLPLPNCDLSVPPPPSSSPPSSSSS